MIYFQSDAEGNISRNDLNKQKEAMASKIQFCETMKHNYASQLVKTNDIRTSYYYDQLPSVIRQLQDLEKNRIELIRTGILDCLAKEREVSYYTFNNDDIIFFNLISSKLSRMLHDSRRFSVVKNETEISVK